MKKILVLLAFVMAIFSAKAQTIDTGIHSVAAVKITAIKPSLLDTGKARWLGVAIAYDDMQDGVAIDWRLINKMPQPIEDNPGYMRENVLLSGSEKLTGEAYQAYKLNNKYLFTWVAAKYGLTITP